jgi:NTP pyrophosphatase (non-canonical NTP hydrolase)
MSEGDASGTGGPAADIDAVPAMADILSELTRGLIRFRDARNWKQFHSAKNLMLSLALEAAEVQELAQWKSDQEFEEALADPEIRRRLGEECADVLLYLLLLCEHAGIDLGAAAKAKMELNHKRYPVSKVHGKALKYNKLD